MVTGKGVSPGEERAPLRAGTTGEGVGEFGRAMEINRPWGETGSGRKLLVEWSDLYRSEVDAVRDCWVACFKGKCFGMLIHARLLEFKSRDRFKNHLGPLK